MCKIKYSFKSPGSDSWKILVSVTYHGESLSASCLSIGKDADIVAIHGRLNQVLWQ